MEKGQKQGQVEQVPGQGNPPVQALRPPPLLVTVRSHLLFT